MEGIFCRDSSEETLLENSELFTFEQLRNITNMRKNFEYKLKKNEKQAYILYIDHELKLFNKIRCHKHKEELRKPIVIRIVKLHTLALSHYKDDLKLWLSYIKFCMQAECCNLISDAFSQMLSCHTEKNLWLLAAKWELKEWNNTEKALGYLYKGLLHHPKASSLYIEVIKMELESLTQDITKKEDIDNKTLTLLAKMQHELPNDIHLYLTLLNIATESVFAIKLQLNITEYMIRSFSNNEALWQCLAQRELNGHHFSKTNHYEFISSSCEPQRIANCVKKFKYATALLKTETIWSKYLNTIEELFENRSDSNEIILKEHFINACEAGHQMNLLSEEHYLKWLKMIQDDESKSIRILKEATQSKPNYINLWVEQIRMYVSRNDDAQIESLFDDATKALNEKSIPIWRLRIQYHQLKSNDKVESIFRKGFAFSTSILMLLRPQFLDWLGLFKTMEIARKEYQMLATQEPFCLQLHKKMLDLEAMCAKPSEETLKVVTKLATLQFGTVVWQRFLNEHITCGLRWQKDLYTKMFTYIDEPN